MVYLVSTKLNGAYIDFQEWITATRKHTGHDSFFEVFVGMSNQFCLGKVEEGNGMKRLYVIIAAPTVAYNI